MTKEAETGFVSIHKNEANLRHAEKRRRLNLETSTLLSNENFETTRGVLYKNFGVFISWFFEGA